MTMQTHYFEYNESHKMPALPVQIHNCAYHHVSYRQCKVFGFGHIVGLSLITVSKPFFPVVQQSEMFPLRIYLDDKQINHIFR